MNKRIAKKWIKALRSGKYKQSTGTLRTDRGFCCLGVLCDLYAKEKKLKRNPWSNKVDVGWDYNWHWNGIAYGSLPRSVQRWAGMHSASGDYGPGERDLAYQNDCGRSFTTIAKIIEDHVEDL